MEVLSTTTSPFKRRKVNLGFENDVELLTMTSPETSPGISLSSISSELQSKDLKEDSFRTEISNHNVTKLRMKISAEVPKTPRKKRMPSASVCRKNASAKMPPAEEVEEFFSAGEKYEHNRFAEKYNFDVVKDVPLEGHYQWIRLKP